MQQVRFSENSLHCAIDIANIDKKEFMKTMSVIADWMLENLPAAARAGMNALNSIGSALQ